MKAERKAEGENEVFGLGFAEAHPILGEAKDNQSRAQRKDENEVFDLNDAEAHPVLWKDSESRAQQKDENEVFHLNGAESHLVLSKDKQSQTNSGQEVVVKNCSCEKIPGKTMITRFSEEPGPFLR